MSERKPLTLEELREMVNRDSEIIGDHVIVKCEEVLCHGVLDDRTDDGICASTGADCEWLKEKDYGKTWVAYSAEPPRLDRSAWEPCEYCGGNVDDRPYLDSEDLYIGYGGCIVSDENGPYIIKINYCPKCGRPLTDAAWEMLEKRLEGAK